MKSFIAPFILIILVAFSCNDNRDSTLTYDLQLSDFTEKLKVLGTVQSVNNTTVLAPRNNYGTMAIAYVVGEGSYVNKGDTICILSSPPLINYYESFITSLKNMEAELIKVGAVNEMNMSLLEAELENTNVQLKLSSLDSLQMKFVSTVNQRLLALKIEKASIEQKKVEKKQSAQKIINDSEVRQIKSRIIQQQGRIQMLKDQIDGLTIVASRDGIVLHKEMPEIMLMGMGSFGTIGGKMEEGCTIFPNMAMLQLPDLRTMQISTGVSEIDYKRVEKGQEVSIRIDAVKDLFTTGRISRKMLVGKSRQSRSKVKTYEVIIEIDSCHLLMQPGLSASCEITINQVKDTIIIPTIAIFERDSLRTVYVADGDMFVPVIIETGKSNSSFTIVSSGLKGDETVALTEPSYSLIKKRIKSKPDGTSLAGSETDAVNQKDNKF